MSERSKAIDEFTKYVEERGFEINSFVVKTTDGYCLTMFRIRNPNFPSMTTKSPLLMVHGGGHSSSQFVMIGSDEDSFAIKQNDGQKSKFSTSLALTLANQGDN